MRIVGTGATVDATTREGDVTRDDLITAMAKARWEALAGNWSWNEVSAEVPFDQRRDMGAAADAVVAFVSLWLNRHHTGATPTSAWALRRLWDEEMGEQP